MTSKIIFGRLALAGCTLMAATGIGQAQLTYTDIGPSAPAPGANDIAQISTDGFITGAGGVINYYDNNSGTANPGSSGQTFKTLNTNPGGYILNGLTVPFGGHSAGGNDTNGVVQGWRIVIYRLSGTGLTNATQVYNVASATSTIHATNSWLQFTGINLPLLANTNYAYTIVCTQNRGSSFNDLGYATNNPYAAGQICRILTAGGQVTYYNTNYFIGGSSTNFTIAGTNISAAFDLGLSLPTGLTVSSTGVSAANPVQVGTTVTLTAGTVVDNVGNGTYAYQWLTDGGSGNGTFTNIPNATNNTYAFNTTGVTLGNYQYQLTVTDSTAQSLTTPVTTVDVYNREFGTLVTTPPALFPFRAALTSSSLPTPALATTREATIRAI